MNLKEVTSDVDFDWAKMYSQEDVKDMIEIYIKTHWHNVIYS